MYKRSYNIHGLHMNIQTSDFGFAQYIENNYNFFKCGWRNDPNLQIDFIYHSKFEKNKKKRIGLNTKPKKSVVLGPNIHLQNNHLFYEARGLKIRLSYDNMKIKIQAIFEETPLSFRMLISPFKFRKNILNYRDLKYSNYHYISRMMIELPLFLLLELRENLSMLHGSCIEKNGHAIIFTGTGECGKSTLASYLVFKKGYKFMADNYILFRSNKVFCFPKNLRLGPKSTNLLEFNPQGSKAWGKYHFKIADKLISRTAHVTAILLTGFAPIFQLKPLSSNDFIEYLSGIHDFLQEFPNYSYLAFLPFLDKKFLSLNDLRRKNLENFVQNVDSYLLRHSKDDPIDKTIRQIQKAIKRA